MEKYGVIIYLIVWAIAIAVPMIFYPTYLDSVSKNAGSVANQIQKLLTDLGVAGSQVAQTAHVVPPTTPPVG